MKDVKELKEVKELDSVINTDAHNSDIQKKFWAALDAINKNWKPRVSLFDAILGKKGEGEELQPVKELFDNEYHRTALQWYNLFIERATDKGFDQVQAEKVAWLMADLAGDLNFEFQRNPEVYNRMKDVWTETRNMAD